MQYLKFCFRHLPIVVIFLFALIIRLQHLDYSFEWDEIYSAVVSSAPYRSLFWGTQYDPGNPPLYFIVLKLWKHIVGESEVRLRLLSIIFFAASFWAIYVQTNKKLDNLSRYIVLILYSGSSALFYFSRFVRAYMFVASIAVIVFPLLIEFLVQRSIRWTTFFLSLLLCLTGFYAHYSFVVFYGMFFLSAMLIHRKSASALLRLTGFSSLLLYLYIPWAYYFISNQISPSAWWHRYRFHQLQTQWGGLVMWLDVFSNSLFSTFISTPLLQWVAFIVLLFIDIVIVRILLKSDILFWIRHVLLLFLLYFHILLFTPLHRIFVSTNYSIYLIPFGLLSIAILLHLYLPKRMKYVFLIVSILLSVSTYKSFAPLVPSDFRSLGQKLTTYTGPGILLFEPCFLGFGLNYYYHQSLPEYCFYENPEGMYLTVWDREIEDTVFLIRYAGDEHKLNSPYHQLIKEYTEKKEYYGNIEFITFKKKT